MTIIDPDTLLQPPPKMQDACYLDGRIIYDAHAPAVYLTGGFTPEAFIIVLALFAGIAGGWFMRGDMDKVNARVIHRKPLDTLNKDDIINLRGNSKSN